MDAGQTCEAVPAGPDGPQPWTQLPERHPGRFGSADPSTPFSTDITSSHTPAPLHLSLNTNRLRSLQGQYEAWREAVRKRPTVTGGGRGELAPPQADSDRAGCLGPGEPGWGRSPPPAELGKAERTLPSRTNGPWGRGGGSSMTFPGPRGMSVNPNGVQTGARALAPGSWKRGVSALGGGRQAPCRPGHPRRGWRWGSKCHWSRFPRSEKTTMPSEALEKQLSQTCRLPIC